MSKQERVEISGYTMAASVTREVREPDRPPTLREQLAVLKQELIKRNSARRSISIPSPRPRKR